MVTKCGCDCSECYAFEKECDGCEAICGKVFWAEEHVKQDTCPIYKCCDDRKMVNCGKCNEVPCKKWYELKDPSQSDEEHIKSINKRVKRLKQN